MEMNDEHEQFFKLNGGNAIQTGFGPGTRFVSIEELYQHFKARMQAEVKAERDAKLQAFLKDIHGEPPEEF